MRRRAEAAAAALLVLAAGCGRPPVSLEIGAHRVRLSPPAGWEVLAQGRQSFLRRGETLLSLTDAGPADAPGMVRELESARALWLAGRRQDAFARVRALHGPPLRFATSEQRAAYWKPWNDVMYAGAAADSAAIGVAFQELVAGARQLPGVSPASLEEYVLERWSDAGRREVRSRVARPRPGGLWTDLVTWSRVSHLDARPLAYLDDGGSLLIVAVEPGDPAGAAPAFEQVMRTISVAPETTLVR